MADPPALAPLCVLTSFLEGQHIYNLQHAALTGYAPPGTWPSGRANAAPHRTDGDNGRTGTPPRRVTLEDPSATTNSSMHDDDGPNSGSRPIKEESSSSEASAHSPDPARSPTPDFHVSEPTSPASRAIMSISSSSSRGRSLSPQHPAPGRLPDAPLDTLTGEPAPKSRRCDPLPGPGRLVGPPTAPTEPPSPAWTAYGDLTGRQHDPPGGRCLLDQAITPRLL